MASDDLLGWLRRLGRVACGDPFGRGVPGSADARTTSAQWCFDALPSEEPGVDRQPAGSEHRQRAGDGCCEKAPNGGSPVVRISEIATTATTAPATGVHNPAMRRSADSASEAEATIMCNGGSLHSLGPACQRTTAPTTSRISSKPIPGQPPANVEYRRRNTYLDTIIRRGGAM